jgi:hypothetical protein
MLPYGQRIELANQIANSTPHGQSSRDSNNYERSKQFKNETKQKYVKELYRLKIVLPSYVTTTNIKADILTKIMPTPNFVRLRTMIGINTPGDHQGKIRGGRPFNDGYLG